MKPILLIPLVLASGCLVGGVRRDYRELTREADALSRAQTAPSGRESDDEAELAREAKLDTIIRITLARNPDLGETRERVKAALDRIRSATRIPDLQFKYEQWAVPLARPWALNEASTLMFGLRQEFPAPGSVRARARGSVEEAAISLQAERARELDIVAQVRKVYYEYYRSEQEYHIHLDHVTLAQEIVELARTNYRVGKGTQQEVLRALVELSKLHNDVAYIEQHRLTARALLNTLMARPVDAPLAPPPEFQPSTVPPKVAELEALIERERPEVLSAARAIKRSEAALDEAKSTLHFPSFMIGADYWYQPTAADPSPTHAYAAMVSFNLPWLNPKHWDDVHVAEHMLAADRRALESARNMAQYQLRDAVAHVIAAQQSFVIIDRDLLAQATQSFQAARADFAAGTGDAIGLLDAFRSYLQVRLDRAEAIAKLSSSMADLDRAIGRGAQITRSVER